LMSGLVQQYRHESECIRIVDAGVCFVASLSAHWRLT
jgi:hypothetical protein